MHQHPGRLTILVRNPPQFATAFLLGVHLGRQRLVQAPVDLGRVGVVLHDEGVDRVEVFTERQPPYALALEDEAAFDCLAVVVRPADEPAGASVGIPVTRPNR